VTSRKENLFLPEGYPETVTSNYLRYTGWNIFQTFCSSALGVLSTQQLLLALGANSLTASAALNWVIKDGLGQLGGVVYAGTVGNKFDENPKHYKWMSSLSLNCSCGLEMLSTLYPGAFLPIAALGTVGKNVSALAGSASKAAIHLSLSKKRNLADLTAKSGTQATASCLFGTFFGTFLGYTFDYSGSLVAFGVLSASHLYACYKSLDCVVLNTLNPQRLDILLQEFKEKGRVLTPEEVSEKEATVRNYKPKDLVVGKLPSNMDIEECMKYWEGKEYLIVEQPQKTFLVFKEEAEQKELVEGYVEARARSWGLEKISLEQMTSKGWDTSQPFLSPNNTRFKVLN